jgi:type IV secretion system protein VirB9
MKRLIGALTMVLFASAASGGSDGAADERIRYLTFDPDLVVTIEAVVGIVVHIVLEPGESYLAHAFGDGKAWDFAYRQHHLFLKPVAKDADSNLTVVTDKRSYHFALKLRTDKGVVPTYELVFRYPGADAKRRRQEAREREVEEALERPVRSPNVRYSMSGDEDLAPVNCWDDGEFTSFKFGPATDLPAIYFVDAEGKESVAGRHTSGRANEIVVMHKVAARWVLRLGQRALLVFNEAFGSPARQNESGTAVADVARVLWR